MPGLHSLSSLYTLGNAVPDVFSHACSSGCLQDPAPAVRVLGRLFTSAEPLPRTLTVRVVSAKLNFQLKSVPSTVVSMVCAGTSFCNGLRATQL